MNTPRITDTDILDDIIRQLEQGDTDWMGYSHAHYEDSDKDIHIDASVQWIVESYDNYIDGYLEGTYDTVVGWEDLEVDAYIGDDPAEIDEEYINNNLTI